MANRLSHSVVYVHETENNQQTYPHLFDIAVLAITFSVVLAGNESEAGKGFPGAYAP
jgi:hypothetical protein